MLKTFCVELKHSTSDNFIKYDIKCRFHIYRTITLIFNNITTVPFDNFLLSSILTGSLLINLSSFLKMNSFTKYDDINKNKSLKYPIFGTRLEGKIENFNYTPLLWVHSSSVYEVYRYLIENGQFFYQFPLILFGSRKQQVII